MLGICVSKFSHLNLLQHSAFLSSEAAIMGDIYWVAGKSHFLKPEEYEVEVLQHNFANPTSFHVTLWGRGEPILLSSDLTLPDFYCLGTQKVCSFWRHCWYMETEDEAKFRNHNINCGPRQNTAWYLSHCYQSDTGGILLTQILSLCRYVLLIHSVMYQN
jgi:hypothetical protein